MKTIYLIILLFFCSCREEKNERLIFKIKNYKKLNHKYPQNLDKLTKSKDYCYFITEDSFNLQYTSFDDLYWYNSGNGFWDFSEGEAYKIYCKNINLK